MSDEKPVRLSAKERAARRREKLLNKDSQEARIKEILEDRLEPGTDIQPRASEKNDEAGDKNNENKSSNDPIDQLTSLLGNKNGIPGMPGSHNNSAASAQPLPLPEKIADVFSTFLITLLLVLISNNILTKEDYPFLKYVPVLTTFNLLFTLMAFSASKYIVMRQSYTRSSTFANIKTFGSIMISPSKLDLFLSGLFIFINAMKNYALFLVMHVVVYNFVVPNFGGSGGNAQEGGEAPMMDIDDA